MHTLCLEKLGLGVKYRDFSGKKLVWRKQPTFSLEKDGFGKENQLFPRENQKNNLLRHYAAGHQKYGFFGFPWEKMVLDRKTNLFLGKRWFGREKPTFS